MKVCFIGVGSIAIKHIKNLKLLVSNIEIHAFRTGKSNFNIEINQLVDKQIFDFNLLDNKYDAVFICNPTSKHLESLIMFKNLTANLFIEKPVFSDILPPKLLSEFDGLHAIVACPLRYDSAIKYLKDVIAGKGNPISSRIICSSYLPEWRDEDYRLTYSAKKELGGGVDIDLIHEIDYMVHLFGFPQNAKTFKGKFSQLEINSCDLAVHIFDYDSMLVEVHLDYIGRKNQRYVELFYNDLYVKADLLSREIEITDNGNTKIVNMGINNSKIDEMRNFIDFCENRNEVTNDIAMANKILKLAIGGE